MPNREHYVKCFLVGGLVLGIPSGVPLLEAFNCFCCMWVILGGGLAGYLLVRWSSYQVTPGEGALVGLLSGIFGAIITSILDALQWLIMGEEYIRQSIEEAMSQTPQEMPPGFEQLMERMTEMMSNPALLLMFGLMFSLVIFSLFAMAGGAMAVSIWGPRKFPPYGYPGGPPPGVYPPGIQPPPSVYIPPPVVPPPVHQPPGSSQFPGPGQGPSGPISPV